MININRGEVGDFMNFRKITAILLAAYNIGISFIFLALPFIIHGKDKIDIIGGADIPTALVVLKANTYTIIFAFSVIVFSIINLISAFKNKGSTLAKWLLSAFGIINCIAYPFSINFYHLRANFGLGLFRFIVIIFLLSVVVYLILTILNTIAIFKKGKAD